MGGIWYPNFSPEIPDVVREAHRRAFDAIYELRDQLGPLAVQSERLVEDTQLRITEKLSIGKLTFPRSGLWLVTAVVHFKVISDGGQNLRAQLHVQGMEQRGEVYLKAADLTQATVSGLWTVKSAKGDVAHLMAFKDAGGGTSKAMAANTLLAASWGGA
jgi:hypothetical protein